MDYSKLSLRKKVFQTFVLDPRQITVSGLSLEEFFEKYPVGAAFVFKPAAEGGDRKRIYPRGLARDVKYNVSFFERTEQSFDALGSEIMEKGIEVVMTEPCASEIIFCKIL